MTKENFEIKKRIWLHIFEVERLREKTVDEAIVEADKFAKAFDKFCASFTDNQGSE